MTFFSASLAKVADFMKMYLPLYAGFKEDKYSDNMNTNNAPVLDFGQLTDMSKNIIKVVGVGGGGCNAVKNMYREGIADVSFAVCNTDSKSLASSPVPVKLLLGHTGLGAGGNPDVGRDEAQQNVEDIKNLLDDGTRMVFITAGMGGGTGTGAAPVVAGVARSMGILTVGIVTIPFFFEKRPKIIKALKGVENMRKNVDALLIINNERLCDVYSDTQVTVKESFRRADDILSTATRSISELITVEGDINLDFRDVEATMRCGGGAIMAMGKASGEHRVEQAILNALDSPLLYGNDISQAKRILFNIYAGESSPLYVTEMNEVDAFMDSLDPNIEVIWGVSDDNSLGEDVKVTILATGLDNKLVTEDSDLSQEYETAVNYDEQIARLYKTPLSKVKRTESLEQPGFTISVGNGNGTVTNVKIEERTGGIVPETDNAVSDILPADVQSGNGNILHEWPSVSETSAEKPNGYGTMSFVERVKSRMARLANDLMGDDGVKE